MGETRIHDKHTLSSQLSERAPSPGSRARGGHGSGAWGSVIADDRRVLARIRTGSKVDARGGLAIARLLDTAWRAEASEALQRLTAVRADFAGLAYATGLLASVSGDDNAAVEWLTRAQALLHPRDCVLGARIAFELGYLYAARGERHVADVVHAWGRALDGGAGAADVVHLEALIETLTGNHTHARALYHEAIRRAANALTPRSLVLALSNLAVSLTHTDPHESAHLSGLALATHRSHHLQPQAEPAVRNILGYALICCGDLREAARVLKSTAVDAHSMGLQQIGLYARFNLAIVDEIQGRAPRAHSELRAIAEGSTRSGLTELIGWCRIRMAWLKLVLGRATPSGALIDGLALREAQIPAAAMIHALAARRAGKLRTAAVGLRRVINDYRTRGDDLGTFGGLLWLGAVENDAGRTSAAARAVNEALTIGQSHDFRLATNFWAAELVALARTLAPPELRDYATRLIPPARPRPEASSSSRVQVSRDGSVWVDGIPVTLERWRLGRTGSKVLRRLFVALVVAYPSALRRDELTDFMWPDSEGDRAVTNLYAAVNDLRAVVADVPGVAVVSRDGAYAVAFGSNVEITEGRSVASRP